MTMEPASSLFLGTTVTAYGISAWLYQRALTLPSGRAAVWARHALIIGIMAHTVLFGGRWVTSGAPPVGSLFGVLLLYGWLIVVGYLLIGGAWRVSALVVYLLPVASASLLLALLLPHEVHAMPPALWSLWLPVHAGSAFLAYATFTIAAVLSLVYLVQEARLRQPRATRLLMHLPPLNVAAAAAYRCVVIGYPMITLALCSGALWAVQVWGTPWSWDPKQTMALITWLLYTFYLRVRATPAWAGRPSAWLLVGGLGCVLLTFLGVSLAGLTEHDFSGR
jgi:cytochrome c-type biogenesis protein CcsB